MVKVKEAQKNVMLFSERDTKTIIKNAKRLRQNHNGSQEQNRY